MKQKLKKIYYLLLFGMIFTLFNCQKDDVKIETDEQRSIFGKVNLNQIPEIKDAIDKKKNRTNFRQNASIYLNLINPENIITIKDNLNYKSYTFALNLEEENQLTNLVVQETASGLQYFLLKYTASDIQKWENDLNNNVISSIQPTILYENLDAPSNTTNKASCQQATIVHNCPSGQHGWGQQNMCDYYFGDWTYQTVFTDVDCGGTTSGTSSPNTGGGGGISSSNPCSKLKNLLDPAKTNIKPRITSLHQAIPNMGSGETGEGFMKNPSGFYSSDTAPQTAVNTVDMQSGINYYSGIHTHPLDTYAMFSFSDLFVLNSLDINSASHNTGMASFLVACIDDNGVPQTYAIVFDPDSLNETLDQFMNNPENIGCTEQEVKTEMDKKLGDEFEKEGNGQKNYERAFLRMIANTNVSLYKANSALTNWGQLKLSSNTSTATVNTTNCN